MRFPPNAVSYLEKWYLTNFSNPYMRSVELDDAANITGLRKEQIRKWLANKRERMKRTKENYDDRKLKGRKVKPMSFSIDSILSKDHRPIKIKQPNPVDRSMFYYTKEYLNHLCMFDTFALPINVKYCY
ncbi:hypothetical protein ACOME3_001821 [Neoechinorhynchus agilis]